MLSADLGVVIPTWNSARTLEAALLSVRQQERMRVRIIVADSGSTDGTLDVCRAAHVDTVYVPPGNMYRAINVGIRMLNTEWLAYLNSDDAVYTDAYQRLVAMGEATGSDVVYGGTDFVDAQCRFLYSLQPPKSQDLGRLFAASLFGFQPHAAIFRKAVFEELGGFSERFRLVADMDFFARAWFSGKAFVSVPPPSVAAFRIHPAQMSHTDGESVKLEMAQITLQWPSVNLLAAWWAVVRWKARNARQYFLRWLRTGSFRKSQP